MHSDEFLLYDIKTTEPVLIGAVCYIIQSNTEKDLFYLANEEDTSELLKEAFGLAANVFFSSKTFNVDILLNRFKRSIEKVEFDSQIEESQLKIKPMKVEEFNEKYKNEQVYWINIKNKKLIKCLKIYSDKRGKFMSLEGDDAELEAIKQSLGNSLKKLLFFTTREILAQFNDLKVFLIPF